jgi:hypothetical protein
MAATELERLGISVVCDCVINDRRKTTEKKGPSLTLRLVEYKRHDAQWGIWPI